jgi:hypothetical protein
VIPTPAPPSLHLSGCGSARRLDRRRHRGSSGPSPAVSRRRRDGRSCACSRREPGQRWGQIGRRRVRAAECCSPARCSTVVRAPAEKARPDGLLDAGLRVLALHPQQVAASRARFRAADGWVVSLIEPQRRDQDVALPHVTNQIPIGPTDRRPVRPRLRVIDQRPLEPRGRRRTATSSSPPSDGDDDCETLSGRRLARRPLLGPRWRRAPRTRLPRWRHKRRRRRPRRRPPCAPRDARLA